MSEMDTGSMSPYPDPPPPPQRNNLQGWNTSNQAHSEFINSFMLSKCLALIIFLRVKIRYSTYI